jgi:hypothetical protein
MGQFIQFGQSASSVSISRVDIAVGYTGYCIPLDNNTLAKNIVYVRGFGNLELDSQSMVEFRLEPQLYYFFLVARLNCDQYGQVASDDITVEYIRMTEKQYFRFLGLRRANPNANAIMLQKEKRTNQEGKDVSSVDYTPATLQYSDAIRQRIQLLTAKPEVIQGLYTQVDAVTSKTADAYRAYLSSLAGGVSQAPGLPTPPPQQQLGPMPTVPPTPPAYGGYQAAPGLPQQTYQAPPAQAAAPVPHPAPAPAPVPPAASYPASGYASAPTAPQAQAPGLPQDAPGLAPGMPITPPPMGPFAGNSFGGGEAFPEDFGGSSF